MKPDNERPTMSIPEAAEVLGIGVNGAYEAAKRGEIPTIRIGKRLLVLREPLRRILHGSSNECPLTPHRRRHSDFVIIEHKPDGE